MKKWRGYGPSWVLIGVWPGCRARLGPRVGLGEIPFPPEEHEQEVRSRTLCEPHRQATGLSEGVGVALPGIGGFGRGQHIRFIYTELQTTHKYQLVDRTQSEQILREKDPGREIVSENAAAAKVGQLLGVQGVIIGTVPEYGVKISGTTELVAMGINARMIDVSDGSIVWSISDIAVSDRSLTLSALANQTVRKMVTQLFEEMIRAGDLQSANLPVPRVLASEGKLRGTIIEIQSDSPTAVSAYKILRSREGQGPFQEAGSIENPGSRTVSYEDRDLLDGETYYYQVSGGFAVKLTSLPSP